MTKISVIALANAIKIGPRQEDVVIANREGRDFYDITLVDSIKIRVECLESGDVAFTSLFNTKWWKEAACNPIANKEQEPASKTAPKKAVVKKL